LFIDSDRLDAKVRAHLHLDTANNSSVKIAVSSYDDVKTFVADLSKTVSGKIWVSY